MIFVVLSALAIAQFGTTAIACTVAVRAKRPAYFRFGGMAVLAAIHSASAALAVTDPGPFQEPIERVCLATFALTLFMLLHFVKAVATLRPGPIHFAQFMMIISAWAAMTGILSDPASEGSHHVSALAMALTLISLFAGLAGLSISPRARVDLTVGHTLVVVLLIVAAGIVLGWPAQNSPTVHSYGIGLSLGTLFLSYIPLYLVVTEDSVLMDASRRLMTRNAQVESLQRRFVRSGRLATVGELSAVIAAQSRAPLRAMVATATSLKATDGDREIGGILLKRLDEENDVLNRLIGDLLRYARPVHAQHEVVSLADLFDEAFEEAARRGRKLKVRRNGIDEIKCDPRLLSAVFQQLVVNAERFMPQSATLTATANRADLDGHPALAVDFQYDRHDFVAFGRRQEDFFGLAMIERIVAVHGGRMHTREDPETGKTHVTLILPEDTPPAAR